MKQTYKNLILMSSSLVPGIGGPLSIFLDKYLPENIAEKRKKFLEMILDDFQRYDSFIKKDIIESDEFAGIFINIYEKILKEYRKEKIISFRNILLSKAIDKKYEYDELNFFIRYVNEFNVDQIKILNYYYQGEIDGHCEASKQNSIFNQMKSIWKDVDEDYLMVCITELVRNRIFVSSSKNTNNKKESVLTPFGKRFVEYIFDPININ